MDILERCKKDYFLTGSKGIFGETFGEDYDFVLHVNEKPKELELSQCRELRNYIRTMPLGNSYLYKIPGIDLLIYEDIRDIDAMKNATIQMKQMVHSNTHLRSFLKIKSNRVNLFEHILKESRPNDEELF